MASTERKLLTLHPGRTRATRTGGCGVVFGTIFVVVGLWVALTMSAGTTASEELDLSWLGYLVAAVFAGFAALAALVLYASALSDTPPRYWELEVSADTPGLDFHALFLLPVYRQA